MFLARFIGPLRAVVPTTAGMMAMPHRKFQAFNVLSAVIWAPLLMSPGHLAWTGYDRSGVGEPPRTGRRGRHRARGGEVLRARSARRGLAGKNGLLAVWQGLTVRSDNSFRGGRLYPLCR